jgi:dTDP-4-dehydrorhamnose reductase
MQKILITGSNGLLGQKLVELIAQKTNYQLIATSRGENRLNLPHLNYEYHSLDITKKEEIETVLNKFLPNIVIHTAAMTNVDECETNKEGCWAQNVVATENIAQFCAKKGIFLLHLSTDFIFDGKSGPYKENDTPNPISYYGESKLAAEKALENTFKDINTNLYAIARTVLVYGIAQDMSRSNIILWVKKSLEERKNIKVVDDQWRTPTLAEDLAEGCFLIVSKKKAGIFNIAGKNLLTPYHMAMAMADFFDLPSSYITRADSSTFSQPAKRPPKTGFILDKAITTLEYQPHSFIEGLSILKKQIANQEIKEV